MEVKKIMLMVIYLSPVCLLVLPPIPEQRALHRDRGSAASISVLWHYGRQDWAQIVVHNVVV